MYAQQNDHLSGDKHECAPKDMQSFRRGEYNIPANYQGNAFTLDEPPTDMPCPSNETCCGEQIQSAPPKLPSEAQCTSICDKAPSKRERGLLAGIFDRFSRGLELDDILLIGLIILLLQNDCDNRDETVILLALLLLGGF